MIHYNKKKYQNFINILNTDRIFQLVLFFGTHIHRFKVGLGFLKKTNTPYRVLAKWNIYDEYLHELTKGRQEFTKNISLHYEKKKPISKKDTKV